MLSGCPFITACCNGVVPLYVFINAVTSAGHEAGGKIGGGRGRGLVDSVGQNVPNYYFSNYNSTTHDINLQNLSLLASSLWGLFISSTAFPYPLSASAYFALVAWPSLNNSLTPFSDFS